METQAERKLRLLLALRSAGIRDNAVLAALESIPREDFVMQPFLDKAYHDTALPILCGQTISQPTIVAMMSEALKVNDRLRVLEIGTGSGYQTAVLSKLCRMVYSIERFQTLHQQAKSVFERMRLRNVNIRCGDGYKGWPEAAPFDRILVTAAAPGIPKILIDQLSDQGGIMVLPVGEESGEQWLMRITKTGQDIREEAITKVRFVPMVSGVEVNE